MRYYNYLSDIPLIQEEMKKLYKCKLRTLSIFSDVKGERTKKCIEAINNDYLEDIKALRQNLKDLYQKRNQLNAKLIRIVNKVANDGTSGTDIWIFKKGCTEQDIAEFLYKCYGVDMEGYSIYSDYDCTGRKFTHDVEIVERKNTIIASQWWGLDV